MIPTPLECEACGNTGLFKAIKYPEIWAVYNSRGGLMYNLPPEETPDLTQFVCYECGALIFPQEHDNI